MAQENPEPARDRGRRVKWQVDAALSDEGKGCEVGTADSQRALLRRVPAGSVAPPNRSIEARLPTSILYNMFISFLVRQ